MQNATFISVFEVLLVDLEMKDVKTIYLSAYTYIIELILFCHDDVYFALPTSHFFRFHNEDVIVRGG